MPQHQRHALDLVQLNADLEVERFASYDDLNAAQEVQPVVCMRVTDGAPAVPSKRETCGKCLAQVWIAPETAAAGRRFANPLIVCMTCAIQMMHEEL
jgi:hypothetical protein